MITFTLKRVLQLIPVFFGATLLVYFLVFATPGDPIAALSGGKPMSPAVEAALRAQYNLDQPFWVQYFLYLKNLVTFDLGQTFSGQAVSDVIGTGLPGHRAPGRHGAGLRGRLRHHLRRLLPA